jgi:hypothetical protein
MPLCGLLATTAWIQGPLSTVQDEAKKKSGITIGVTILDDPQSHWLTNAIVPYNVDCHSCVHRLSAMDFTSMVDCTNIPKKTYPHYCIVSPLPPFSLLCCVMLNVIHAFLPPLCTVHNGSEPHCNQSQMIHTIIFFHHHCIVSLPPHCFTVATLL